MSEQETVQVPVITTVAPESGQGPYEWAAERFAERKLDRCSMDGAIAHYDRFGLLRRVEVLIAVDGLPGHAKVIFEPFGYLPFVALATTYRKPPAPPGHTKEK